MKIWSTRVFIGLLILIFSFSQLPVASASSVNASKMEEIDTFVNNQMKRHGIPGLALALVDGDKAIHFGVSEQAVDCGGNYAIG